MAVTILEALQNARYNLKTSIRTNMYALLPLAEEQLSNAVELLDKGYPLDTLVEPLLEKYGPVENVPEFPKVLIGMGPTFETEITMLPTAPRHLFEPKGNPRPIDAGALDRLRQDFNKGRDKNAEEEPELV